MEYLKFTLLFCVLFVVFEWMWVIISFILFKIFSIFKSESVSMAGMVFDKITYCVLIMVLTCLAINFFRKEDSGLFFKLYCTFIPVFYFIFFFQDRRMNAEKRLMNNANAFQFYMMQEMVRKKNEKDILIEYLFHFSFAFFLSVVSTVPDC